MSDEEWAFFSPFVIEAGPRRGRRASDHRLMRDGGFWIVRAGFPWRDLHNQDAQADGQGQAVRGSPASPPGPTTSGPWTFCVTGSSMAARSASWLSSTPSAGSRRRWFGVRLHRACDVVQTLEMACKAISYPRGIQVGNSSEFVFGDLNLWAKQQGVTLKFSGPDKPTDNALAESFGGSSSQVPERRLVRVRRPLKMRGLAQGV